MGRVFVERWRAGVADLNQEGMQFNAAEGDAVLKTAELFFDLERHSKSLSQLLLKPGGRIR